jgi:hypothetical protein
MFCIAIAGRRRSAISYSGRKMGLGSAQDRRRAGHECSYGLVILRITTYSMMAIAGGWNSITSYSSRKIEPGGL